MDDVRDSIVLFSVRVLVPDPRTPWVTPTEEASHAGGVGFIIAGRRILTCAHSLVYVRRVRAKRAGRAGEYEARVLHVDCDRELGVLTVDDEEFWDGARALELGALPELGAPLTLVGVNAGTSTDVLEASRGSVVGVALTKYGLSQRHLLVIESDAAAVPGYSGAPAIGSDGALLGVAFQELEGRVHLVPSAVVTTFLEDARDGAIAGVPDLGVYTQKSTNPALRSYLRLPDAAGGAVVSRVVHGASCAAILEENDVICAVDGHAVARDETIPCGAHRVHFTHAVSRHQIGDVVALEVWRDGALQHIAVPLKPYVALVPPPRPDVPPRYLILGGLVFAPMTYELASAREGGLAMADFRIKHWYYEGLPSPARREIVVLTHVLEHELTADCADMRGAAVAKVNGVPITELRDLARALRSPLAGHHVIELERHAARLLVLDARLATLASYTD
ncbi:MAG: PDZ domain-containing protein [Deltaproteobacteria bacterium]|nr:PDZ domain-containing protein [Deltaproteobacteria bacterium]